MIDLSTSKEVTAAMKVQNKKNSLIVAFLLLFILSSCSGGDDARPRSVLRCAEPRLDVSFDFHQKAKNYLGSYYKTRKESELFYAWYASEDSIYMANTVRKCRDKRNKHYHAVQNIFHKNRILRNVIVQNMRQDSQTLLSELFLDDYRKIFVRDIQ